MQSTNTCSISVNFMSPYICELLCITLQLSSNIDVLVIHLYCYHLGVIGKEAGHVGTNTSWHRNIPMHIIGDKLGDNVFRCLPATHALTGCDKRSVLIGKSTAYRTLSFIF